MLGVGVGAREHRHHRENQRQFAVVGAGEIEPHGRVVGRLDAFDQRVGGALRGKPLRLEQVEGEDDVGGGDLAAVGKMSGRVDMKGDEIARIVGLDRPRDEAVKRERLVGRTHHQRLIDVADEALRGRQSLDVVRIEAVERAEIGEVEAPALGRVGVDVGQMREVRPERRGAVHGDRGGRRRLVGSRRPAGRRRRGEGGERTGESAGVSCGYLREQAPARHRPPALGRAAGSGVAAGPRSFDKLPRARNSCWIVAREYGKRSRTARSRGAPLCGLIVAARVAGAASMRGKSF